MMSDLKEKIVDSNNLREGHACIRALSDERFLAPGGQAAFAMSHKRFGR